MAHENQHQPHTHAQDARDSLARPHATDADHPPHPVRDLMWFYRLTSIYLVIAVTIILILLISERV